MSNIFNPAAGGGGGGITAFNITAGTTNTAASGISFANSNGVTFGLNGNTITASVGAAGGGLTNINVSAGTTSQNLSALTFSNSNGVTFGLNGSVITASHNGLTSQSNQVLSGSNGSFAFQTATFGNLNGVSFYTSNGSMVASYTVPNTAGLLSAINVSAGTTSNNLSAVTFSNSNGVSFGLNGSVITGAHNGLTTARASTDAIGLNTAQTNVTWTVNSSGLSLNAAGYAGTGTSATNASITLNSNGLAISVAAPGGGGAVNFSAGTTSNNLQSVVFSNSNGVSFGLNGSTITASAVGGGGGGIGAGVSTGGNTAGSTGTITTGNMILVGGSNISLSQSTGAAGSNATVTINGPASSSIVGNSGISVSAIGSTISIYNLPINMFEPLPVINSTTFLQPVSQLWFCPFELPAPISGGRLNVYTIFGSTSQLPRATTSASFGSNTSGQKSMRYQYSLSAILYSIGAGTNSTRLESIWSNLASFELSHNLSISGNAGSMTVSNGVTLSAVSDINSAGEITTTTYGTSSTVSTNVSTMNSTAISSIHNQVNNLLSNSLVLPIPFNTTINPGQYFLGLMYHTASTTGGSSQVGFAIVGGVGNSFAQLSAYRMLG